jgi:hypothetical protein
MLRNLLNTLVIVFMIGFLSTATSKEAQAQVGAPLGNVTTSLPNGTKISAGNVSVKVEVQNLTPNSSYTFEVVITNTSANPTVDGSLVTGTVTTDANGNGTATVTATAPAGTTNQNARVRTTGTFGQAMPQDYDLSATYN